MPDIFGRPTLQELSRSPAQEVANGLLSPVTANPLMAAQLLRARQNMTQPTSVMDERYPAWKKSQDQADAFLTLADIAGSAVGAAPYAAKGLMAAGRYAGPTLANALESHMARSGMMPQITAYHGSPHKFDKFDMSKIGTGEGAQAYGHGLYLAENRAVAKGYSNGLGKIEINEGPVNFNDPAHVAAYEVHLKGGDFAKAADSLYRSAIQRTSSASPSVAKQASEILDGIIDNKAIPKSERLAQLPPVKQGNLYKVDLPDEHIAKMLDWDKPLSQQPESVRKALENIGEEKLSMLVNYGWPLTNTKDAWKATGAQLYEGLGRGKNLNSKITIDERKAFATNELKNLGIPGIRYLDGGSRAGGQGTSNFVVFDDKIPKILGRE